MVTTVALVSTAAAPVMPPTGLATPVAAAARTALPLGPADLAEERTTATLQPGVTLTTIVRGAPDPRHVWTVEVPIAPGGNAPDPDTPAAALADRASADVLAARLRAAGFDPRVEEATTPATADYAGGRLGWRVRVGLLPTRAEADAAPRPAGGGGVRRQHPVHRLGRPGDRPRAVAGPGADDRPAPVPRVAGRLLRTGHRRPRDDQRAEHGRRRHRGGERRLLRAGPGLRSPRRPGRRRRLRRQAAERDDRPPARPDPAGQRPADRGGAADLVGLGAGPRRRPAPAGRDRPRPRTESATAAAPATTSHRSAAARLHLHRRRRADRLHPGLRSEHPGRAGSGGGARPPRARGGPALPAGRAAAPRPTVGAGHRVPGRPARGRGGGRRAPPGPHQSARRRPTRCSSAAWCRRSSTAARSWCATADCTSPRGPTASSARPSPASTTGSAPPGTRAPSPASTPAAAPCSRPSTAAAPPASG